MNKEENLWPLAAYWSNNSEIFNTIGIAIFATKYDRNPVKQTAFPARVVGSIFFAR